MTMQKSNSTGLIFISHASADKDFVSSVISKIPKSHLFYDVDTIEPGEDSTEALDNGLWDAAVFAMFVSPNTKKGTWAEYEASVALTQKVRRSLINVVAIPIKGVTYRDAPDWMQRYMAVPPGYNASDIARLLKYLYENSLRAQGVIKPALFIGREEFCNSIVNHSRTKSAESGIPVNFINLAGIPGMGKLTISRHITSKVFPGSREDLPVFELPKYADAVNLFMALRQDMGGDVSPDWIAEQLASFPTDPSDQAKLILNNLLHFSSINQTVIIKSSYGLRNQEKALKPWISSLFTLLRAEPNTRIIWLSERLLPAEVIAEFPNVAQYSVPELSEDSTLYLLNELLDSSSNPSPSIGRLAPYIHGHPATAHYVADLVSAAQRSPDSLIGKPDAIRSFQEKCIENAISADRIGVLGRDILLVLRLLRWASYPLIVETFNDYPKEEISESLWSMTDSCIVTFNMTNGYKLADIVASAWTVDVELDAARLSKLAEILSRMLQDDSTSVAAVEAFVFAQVRLKGALPQQFKKVLTGSMLLDLVEQYYRQGHNFVENWQEKFRIAAKLSLLAFEIPMPADTLETILFNGGDSLIRIGEDPMPIIEMMQRKKFLGAYYLLGNYYYRKKGDLDAALAYLEAAFNAKSYVVRTGRLLARVYQDKGMPKLSLKIFEKLGDARVNRDSGLLAQKVRCLRAAGMHAEANALVPILSRLDDDLGEYDILVAARLMREQKYSEALEAVARAKQKPKSNRINLRLLETAILIEKGDFSSVDETYKMATAIGLSTSAASLMARFHLKNNRWKDAETELNKISNKNYYDRLLLLRMLNQKKADLATMADPVVSADVVTLHQECLVSLHKDGEGDWLSYE